LPEQEFSRWQLHEKATGKEPELPSLEAGDYLASAFMDIGLCQSAGYGPQLLSWQEINAFSQMTGAIRSRWEGATIRNMSAAYIEGRKIGDDAFGIVPWEPPHD